MFWISLAALALSVIGTFIVVASVDRHASWSADHDVSGPQKMHAHVVSRIGGVGIALGLAAAAGFQAWQNGGIDHVAARLLLAALPAFVFGLVEDVTKNVSPGRRLAATAVSGALGIWLLGAELHVTGWAAADAMLAVAPVAWLATVFAVAGIVNSVNIIDGMNGLSSMCVAMAMAALAWIAWRVGDTLMTGLALATIGAVLGFFLWNYPRGLIFLGDGGAYLLGFMLAETGLLLLRRNPQVSPLAPLLAMFYPIFETVFTMYRRKVLSGRPVSRPDGSHLHTLLYRRVFRWSGGDATPEQRNRLNSATSPWLWLLNATATVPAALFWNRTDLLAEGFLLFVVLYLLLYWRVVRFRTPGWLKPRRRH